MAPVQRNGVLLKSTGPDSGERRVGKHAHSAPGQDATLAVIIEGDTSSNAGLAFPTNPVHLKIFCSSHITEPKRSH